MNPHLAPRPRDDRSRVARRRARINRRLAYEVLEQRALLSLTAIQPVDGPTLPIGSGPVDPALLNLASAASPNGVTPAVSEGLGSQFMQFDSTGRVAVEFSAVDPEALASSLQGLGASISAVDDATHMIDAYVPIDQLTSLSGLVGDGLLAARPVGMLTSAGAFDAQADQMTEADRLRATNSLTGSGVTVGVLSDSYNNQGGAAADIASGDLSSPVFVRDNIPGNTGVTGEDEGRAMMQIVHDVAPGAGLAFATAEGGQAVMAQNIKDLAKSVGSGGAGAKVITDDISYFAEPFYQDGTIAQAVDTVAAGGVVYTASAGNIDHNGYENTSPSLTSDPVFTGNGTNFINFGTAGSPTSRQSVHLNNGQAFIITLEWDSPFFNGAGDTVNLSIFLIDQTTNAILAGGNVNTIGSGQPVQIFSFQNTSGAAKNYDIAIVASGGTPGRLKWVNYGANNFGDMTINTPAVAGVSTNAAPTMNGHAQSANALAAAAAPYFNQTVPETFSSFGPTTILFSADGLTRLGSPTVRAKPDLTAVDGVRTTFFPSAGSPFFFGTSAATPNVAGLAALYFQTNAGATPAQVRSALIASARPMQTNANNPATVADVNQVGAGLVSGFRAVNGAATPAAFDVADNFDTAGGLNNSWTNTSRFTGQVQLAGTEGPTSPLSSPNQLVLDELDNTFAFGGAAQADLTVAGASSTDGNDVGLAFQSAAIGGLAAGFAMPASFSTFVNADGVAISADGVNWTRVKDLSTSTTSYSSSRLNLSSIASAAGIPLTSTFILRFQGTFLATLASQGLVFDNLRVTRLQASGAAASLKSLVNDQTPSMQVATFTDGLNPVNSYTVSVNWGDGSPNSAGAASVVTNSINVSVPTHVYTTSGNHTYTVTVTDTSTGRTASTTGTATTAAEITPQVQVTKSGLYFQRSTNMFVGTVTLTNIGGVPITGSSIVLAFTNLPAGVSLDPTLPGFGFSPSGVPTLTLSLGGPLGVGQSVVFTVRYIDPSKAAVTYNAKSYLFA